jgi:heterotetrameric sarcosine oxidase gamma subunit
MARRTSDSLVVGIAPGEWLVFGGSGVASILVTAWSKLVGSPGCAAVDLTHARAAMRLTGPLGPAILSRLCALDVASMPDGTSAGTLVAGVVTGVIRDDALSGPSYLLHCDRSYGQSLARAILEAGWDYGLEADGYQGARALDPGLPRTEVEQQRQTLPVSDDDAHG